MKLLQTFLSCTLLFNTVFCGILYCGNLRNLYGATDFKIGPDNSLDSVVLCAGSSNYLVVWRDLRSGNSLPQLRGATISATGVISADFAISDAAGLPSKATVQRQTVAFDGTNFLVVWVDTRSTGAGLRGVRLDTNGTVLGGGDFLISTLNTSSTTLTTNTIAPLVVYTGLDYGVAWQDTPLASSGTQISFCRVSTTTGIISPPVAIPSSVSAIAQSLEFLIRGPSNEVLIIYQDTVSTPAVTRATRIQSNSSFSGSAEGELLFKNDFSSTGFGSPIGAAFDGTEYHILSSYGAHIDSSIFRTRLTPGSTPIRPSAPFAEVGQGVTGLAENNFPRAHYNGAGEFLFLRNSKVSETAYHILSKRVTLDGTDRDPNLPLIDSASRGILNGAVAANLGTQYLVIWMDGRRPETQPADQVNLYGLLIDGTLLGDETKPYIKAVARARPIFGNPPLTVSFGNTSSTGIVDSFLWEFGDTQSEATPFPIHIYEVKGDFTAVLSLIRAGVYYRDYIRVLVASDALGGSGGPPEISGGILGTLSDNLDADTVISSAGISLSFSTTQKDAMRIVAFVDPTYLPISVAGRTGTFTIAGREFPFTLDANAVYISTAGTTPVVTVGLNRANGALVLNTSSNELASILAPYGCGNETTDKKGKSVSLPATLSFADQTFSATLTGTYSAQAGKSGRFTYQLGSVGYPSTGLIRTSSGKATETTVNKTESSHTFVVTGFMSPGGETSLSKADTGGWKITLGNFSETIPVSSLTVSGDLVTYSSKVKGQVGIIQFFYNNRTRLFGVYLKGVAATGNSPSGMALANSQFTRVDMALSFDVDLQGATKFQASTFVRFGRSKLNSKKWVLR